MARVGKDKCGCTITVLGTYPAQIPAVKIDRCPLHKNAERLLKAGTQLLLVIHEQIPDTTTSKKFQDAVLQLLRATSSARGKT